MPVIHRLYGRYSVDYPQNTYIEKDCLVVEVIRHNSFVRLAVRDQSDDATAPTDTPAAIDDFACCEPADGDDRVVINDVTGVLG